MTEKRKSHVVSAQFLKPKSSFMVQELCNIGIFKMYLWTLDFGSLFINTYLSNSVTSIQLNFQAFYV